MFFSGLSHRVRVALVPKILFKMNYAKMMVTCVFSVTRRLLCRLSWRINLAQCTQCPQNKSVYQSNSITCSITGTGRESGETFAVCFKELLSLRLLGCNNHSRKHFSSFKTREKQNFKLVHNFCRFMHKRFKKFHRGIFRCKQLFSFFKLLGFRLVIPRLSWCTK